LFPVGELQNFGITFELNVPVNIEVPLQGTVALFYNPQGDAPGYDEIALQATVQFWLYAVSCGSGFLNLVSFNNPYNR